MNLRKLNSKKGFYNRSSENNFRRNIPRSSKAQFIMQPSKFVQRLYAINEEKKTSKVKYERGKSLFDILHNEKSFKWANKHRFEIADQLADSYFDFMNLGVVHRDFGAGNLVISKNRTGKPVLKIIDFEFSIPLDKEGIKILSETEKMRKEFSEKESDGVINDFSKLQQIAERLAKTNEEEKEIKRYFRRKFEKLVNERYGVY